MNKIVECIPNFSEGRDEAKLGLIARAIASIPHVAVLDLHMDGDHNRSVITFAGDPEGVVEAAVRAAETAVELIDLNQHLGEHPRIGALDVLPFVPIRGVTMTDCVALARRAGERIARTLRIPVYLYEAAAMRPDREDLANIRRGEFESLRREIEELPDRAPDFGERRVHPTAGAMAIGARPPLIAYNINLATEDLSVAKRIARAVRGSSGGLQYVKALAMDLKNRRQVQVSMNLTDYELTPLFRVFEMVRREAERYGVQVAGSELVGLIPQAALNACTDFYLRFENFSEDSVLENRLQAELDAFRAAPSSGRPALEERRPMARPLPLTEPVGVVAEEEAPEETPEEEEGTGSVAMDGTPIATYADVIASGAQTPDGVSIAAYAGALAASLGGMLCNLTIGQRPAAEKEASAMLDQLDELRTDLYRAINEDAETRELVLDAISLSQESEGEILARTFAIEQATKNAVAIPLRVAENAVEVLELLKELTEIGNPSGLADLATGAQLAMAAIRGAVYNTFANLSAIQDEDFNQDRRGQAAELYTRGRAVTDEIEALFFRAFPR
jgi:glutamate formiminotransferase/formiminotetrahydrofolate cyclodeaminase